MSDPRPVRVPIDEIDTIALLRHSIQRHDAMSRTSTAYQRSDLRMQDVGLLGEYAVCHWLKKRHSKVTHIADTALGRSQGDIALQHPAATPGTCRAINFEVKTSRYSSWRRYGRTLDAAQLARSTADAYIWCVVSNTWPTESVLLMGWMPTADIRQRPGRRAVVEHDRPHWQVITPMRSMSAVDDWCASLPFTPS